MLWHDNIDKQQKRVSDMGQSVTDALIGKVDQMQQQIESDSTLTGQAKIKYLRSLESLVKGYADKTRQADFPASMAPDLVKAYEKAMELDRSNASIEPVIESASYGIGKILVDCFLYPSENPGVPESRTILLQKYCILHPSEIFHVLK